MKRKRTIKCHVFRNLHLFILFLTGLTLLAGCFGLRKLNERSYDRQVTAIREQGRVLDRRIVTLQRRINRSTAQELRLKEQILNCLIDVRVRQEARHLGVEYISAKPGVYVTTALLEEIIEKRY